MTEDEQPERRELTLEQKQIIDQFLDGYAHNPSNSNKYRIALHAFIEDHILNNEPLEVEE